MKGLYPEHVLDARKDVEATKKYQKKFVRYQEGAEKYSLGLTKFQALAKEAKAVYKIDCNLRRPAATDAMLSGHPAEPNGHPC